MSFYGSNVDAILEMGQSTADPLPAIGSDTFEEVALTGSLTPPPAEKQTAFFNVTNDANRRSLGGRLADQLLEGSVVLDWEEDTHNDMYADSKAAGAVYRNWRLTYPTGRTLTFQGFVSKWSEEPMDAGEDAKEHRASFTIAISGAITATNPP